MTTFVSAQEEVVTWKTAYDPVGQTIIAYAEIKDGWHIYSQEVNDRIGPVPTHFEFVVNPMVEIVGTVVEPEPIEMYDKNFEGNVLFFENQVAFTQGVRVQQPTELKGVVTFMVCNKEMCLPPKDQELIFQLK